MLVCVQKNYVSKLGSASITSLLLNYLIRKPLDLMKNTLRHKMIVHFPLQNLSDKFLFQYVYNELCSTYAQKRLKLLMLIAHYFRPVLNKM
jgi:hypothetical protein